MDIHLPTRPNIPLELMKYRAWGILVWIILAICIILLSYLLWRIAKVVISHYRYYQTRQHLLDNLRATYITNFQQLEGREFIVALLGYLERYGAQKNYNSLEDILHQLWIDKEKTAQVLLLYYSHKGDEKHLSKLLKHRIQEII